MIALAGAVAVEALDPSSVDVGVAAHYGDPFREQRALATVAGIVDRSHRPVIGVSGPDRLDWLHNITTQHLLGLPPLVGTETLVLSPHGHLEHHAVLFDDGTTTWLDIEPRTAAGLLEFLHKMRFLLRVEPVDASAERAVLSLVGPQTPAVLEALGAGGLAEPDVVAVPGPKFPAGSVPARPTMEYAVSALAVPGVEGGFARRMPHGADLLVPRDAMPTVVAAADAAGAAPAGLWAYEAMRVEHRQARLGVDTDHKTLPAEVDWIAPAVHLEKGCYRGQETVARVHNLGRPPRRLVLLHLDGVTTDQPPAPGTAVTNNEGRVVGRVGTAVRHHELGQVALALVKQNTPDDAPLRIGDSTAAIDSGSDR
jgi:folate-binding protein YgfZ